MCCCGLRWCAFTAAHPRAAPPRCGLTRCVPVCLCVCVHGWCVCMAGRNAWLRAVLHDETLWSLFCLRGGDALLRRVALPQPLLVRPHAHPHTFMHSRMQRRAHSKQDSHSPRADRQTDRQTVEGAESQMRTEISDSISTWLDARWLAHLPSFRCMLLMLLPLLPHVQRTTGSSSFLSAVLSRSL